MTAAGIAERRSGEASRGPELLVAEGLSAGYGGNPVIRGIDLHVHAGEVVGLLGANGAGKTTTLLALAGELKPIKGAALLLGAAVGGGIHTSAKRGLGFVTEERSVIFSLSVLDNLRLGRGDIDKAFTVFPELVPLKRRIAGSLSGGEQQMLTFARALSRSPRVLLADEMSLGLAPMVVQRLGRAIREAAAQGVGVLLVEQQARTALALADRAYVLRQGQVVLEGTTEDLAGRLDEVEAGYLSE